MSKILKLLFLFSFCLTFFVLSFTPIRASEEFITKYEATYQVHPPGLMAVSQKISLTNKLSNVYATEYNLSVGNLDLQNVKAWDGEGPLKIATSKSESNASINLVFNEKVVGKNKTLDFTLEYKTSSLIYKKGKIWEIIIPKVANIETIDDYQLKLNVPLGFGQAAYLSPTPIKREPPWYFFSKAAATKGVVAAFGDFQIFDFTISYQLKNPEISPKNVSVTLPPDTYRQKVILERLEPKPEEIIVDEDGNWLATYALGSTQELEVIVTGSAQIFPKPLEANSREEISRDDYLKPRKYWEVDDKQIQELAQKLKTPQEIYNFIVQTFSYDYQRIDEAERLGAKEALLDPQSALCMEFTDLFVALCRAAGIPAREINGYAHTDNPQLKPLSLEQDVLHAWPEYWDEKTKAWIPVDPTWEKTTGGVDFFHKLDLNHFTLAIHGLSSEYPLAPGIGSKKNIEVDFATDLPKVEEDIQVDFDIPEQPIAGIETKGQVIIKNTGNVAFHQLSLVVNSDQSEIETLPPLANYSLPISLSKSSWWKTKKERIIVSVDQYQFEKEIEIKPFFLQITYFLTKLILSGKTLFR
jgi:transglutaminase-like putative cysteine protease